MPTNPTAAKPPSKPSDGSGEAPVDDDSALRIEQIERIAAEMAACAALGDVDLTRRTGRKLLTAVACAADALLRDGGQALQAAPDKFGAFFDKAAAAFVQAVEGMRTRAALMEVAALDAKEVAPARPRAADPLANAFAAWSAPVIPPPQSGGRVEPAPAKAGGGGSSRIRRR